MRLPRNLIAVAALTTTLLLGISAAQTTGSGLAASSYPKFRADLQNTGRGGGSGATGEKKWEFSTGFEIYSSPVLGLDGLLYIVSNDHHLYALDAQTGEKKWDFGNDTLGGSSSSPGQAPAVGADGTVYLGDPGGYDDSNRGELLALDGKTGSVKWAFKAKAPVYTSPTIANGLIYFGSHDGFLYAVNSAGKLKWKTDGGGQIHSSPAIGTDGTVYFGSDDTNVYALDGMTGKVKWSVPTNSYVHASPAIGADGTVYICSTGSLSTGPATLYALDGQTGKQKWTVENLGGEGSAAIGKDGTVFIQDGEGHIVALDGKTGAKKWDVIHGGNSSSPSIGADGSVYVLAGTTLYALDPADGSDKWDIELGRFGISSPAIGADGTIYFGSGDQKVYAVH